MFKDYFNLLLRLSVISRKGELLGMVAGFRHKESRSTRDALFDLFLLCFQRFFTVSGEESGAFCSLFSSGGLRVRTLLFVAGLLLISLS